MMNDIITSFAYLMFVIFYSIVLYGVHRKVVARMQNRKGPPVLQPLYDVIKLLWKENLSYRASNHELWLSFSLLTVTISCLLLTPFRNPFYMKECNAILVVLLLSASYLFLIFSGLGSFSVFGEIGGMRALLQFISFEGAFIMASILPVFYSSPNMTLPIPVDKYLLLTFPFLGIAYVLTILPQLNIQPFNIPDAHQEIVTGYATEFSSVSYALSTMIAYLKLYALISLFTLIYLNGPLAASRFFAVSLAIVLIISAIRAALARTRIKNTVKIYVSLTILVALIAVVKAYV